MDISEEITAFPIEVFPPSPSIKRLQSKSYSSSEITATTEEQVKVDLLPTPPVPGDGGQGVAGALPSSSGANVESYEISPRVGIGQS
jgi:hypothetical protein